MWDFRTTTRLPPDYYWSLQGKAWTSCLYRLYRTRYIDGPQWELVPSTQRSASSLWRVHHTAPHPQLQPLLSRLHLQYEKKISKRISKIKKKLCSKPCPYQLQRHLYQFCRHSLIYRSPLCWMAAKRCRRQPFGRKTSGAVPVGKELQLTPWLVSQKRMKMRVRSHPPHETPVGKNKYLCLTFLLSSV